MFDCEEMIARNGCNINAGAQGIQPGHLMRLNKQVMYRNVQQYGMPSRSFFADAQIIGKISSIYILIYLNI